MSRLQILEDQAKVPPGLKLLTDDERFRLLEELDNSRRELQNALEKMPLSLSTQGRVEQKRDLELKLKNVEDALAKFQTKKEIFIDISGKEEEQEYEEDLVSAISKKRKEEEA